MLRSIETTLKEIAQSLAQGKEGEAIRLWREAVGFQPDEFTSDPPRLTLGTENPGEERKREREVEEEATEKAGPRILRRGVHLDLSFNKEFTFEAKSWNLLFWAARHNRSLFLADLLHEQTMYTDATRHPERVNLLTLAILEGHVPLACFLSLKMGTHLDLPTATRKNALHLALERGYLYLLQLILLNPAWQRPGHCCMLTNLYHYCFRTRQAMILFSLLHLPEHPDNLLFASRGFLQSPGYQEGAAGEASHDRGYLGMRIEKFFIMLLYVQHQYLGMAASPGSGETQAWNHPGRLARTRSFLRIVQGLNLDLLLQLTFCWIDLCYDYPGVYRGRIDYGLLQGCRRRAARLKAWVEDPAPELGMIASQDGTPCLHKPPYLFFPVIRKPCCDRENFPLS